MSILNFENQPVSNVQWIHIDKIECNNYNPNMIAKNELKLLYISILYDGYTQPIVTIYDKNQNKYIIIDGFHRYLIMKKYKDIYDRTDGYLPIVTLANKDKGNLIASTIRHNRARGKHSIAGMSNIVFSMLDEGMTDKEIIEKLGLETEELNRLKYITGFAKLFEGIEYKKAWEIRNQIKLRKEYIKNEGRNFTN